MERAVGKRQANVLLADDSVGRINALIDDPIDFTNAYVRMETLGPSRVMSATDSRNDGFATGASLPKLLPTDGYSPHNPSSAREAYGPCVFMRPLQSQLHDRRPPTNFWTPCHSLTARSASPYRPPKNVGSY